MVVIDLKGEDNLLGQTLFENVAQLRRTRPGEFPTWHFSNVLGESSYLFNPFLSKQWSNFSPRTQAQFIITAGGMAHGPGYGRSYFEGASRFVLNHVLAKYREDGRVVKSFSELAPLLTNAFDPRYKAIPQETKKSAEHLLYVVTWLAAVENISQSSGEASVLENAIDLARFTQEPCFAMFRLNPYLEPASSGEIARLVISGLFTLSAALPRKQPVLIIIDEFSNAVGESLAHYFRAARSARCGFCIATQSVADLQQGSVDLTSTVLSNTATQIFLGARDLPTIKLLLEISGPRVEFASTSKRRVDWDHGLEHREETLSETLVPRLVQMEIERVSSNQHLGFIRLSENSDYVHSDGAMSVYRWTYDIDEETAIRRMNAPWPAATDSTITVGESEPVLPSGIAELLQSRLQPPIRLGRDAPPRPPIPRKKADDTPNR